MRYAFFIILIAMIAVTTLTCSSKGAESTSRATGQMGGASSESTACRLVQRALIKTARELTEERLAVETALRQRGLDTKAIAIVWREIDSSQCARAGALSKDAIFACMWMRSRPADWVSLRARQKALSTHERCYAGVDHSKASVAQAHP